MKQFKSQLLSLYDAYLATQQAQTIPDAAANRASRTAQTGMPIAAGPATGEAGAESSAGDLCKHRS